MSNEGSDNVLNIEQSPLTIGQRNFMKRVFNHHKDEMDGAFKTHREEISKIFESYSKQIAETIKHQNGEMVKQMNESLATIDKKFSGMYSVLVNKFLVKQEEKVFLCELGVQALLECTCDSLVEILKISDEGATTFREHFQKRVEDKITYLAEEMKKELESKALAETQQNGDQNAGQDKAVGSEPAGEPAAPTPEAPAQNS